MCQWVPMLHCSHVSTWTDSRTRISRAPKTGTCAALQPLSHSVNLSAMSTYRRSLCTSIWNIQFFKYTPDGFTIYSISVETFQETGEKGGKNITSSPTKRMALSDVLRYWILSLFLLDWITKNRWKKIRDTIGRCYIFKKYSMSIRQNKCLLGKDWKC